MKNKEAFKNFMRRYKWIFIWALLSIVIAFIIHICFKAKPSNEFWSASWGAGEILTYISTIALGLLALYQNQKITEDSNERDEYKFAIDHNVLFDFGNITATYMNDAGQERKSNLIESGFNGNKAVWKYHSVSNMSILQLKIEIENIGECTATNLHIADIKGHKIDNTNILHNIDGTNDKKYIVKGQSGIVIICVNLSELNAKDQLEYYLTFANPFGNCYSQKIIVSNQFENLIQIDTQSSLNIKQKRKSK